MEPEYYLSGLGSRTPCGVFSRSVLANGWRGPSTARRRRDSAIPICRSGATHAAHSVGEPDGAAVSLLRGTIDALPAAGVAVGDDAMVIEQRGFCADCGRAVRRIAGDAGSLGETLWEDGLSEMEREFWEGER